MAIKELLLKTKEKPAKLIFILVTMICFAVLGLLLNFNVLFLLVMELWILAFFISTITFLQDVFVSIFLVSLFVFLLGGELVYEMFGLEPAYSFGEANNNHVFLSLSIALIGLIIGLILSYKFWNKGSIYLTENKVETQKNNVIRFVRIIVIVLFIFSALAYIAISLERWQIIRQTSFQEIYIEGFRSSLPYLIQKVAEMNTVLFAILLATLPKGKQLVIPVILFVLIQILDLLQGFRFTTITTLGLLLGYFAVINNIDVWRSLTQRKSIKVIIASVIILIALVIGLNVINLKRFNRESEEYTDVRGIPIVGELVDFLYNQGFSINVIKLGKEYEDELPEKNYVFGMTIDYVSNSPIGRALGWNSDWYFGGNSEAKALEGHNFAHAITHTVSPWYYSTGRGYGSSYIAELYHDYGYLGIFLCNILIPLILGFLFKKGKFIGWTIGILSFPMILRMPRANTDMFIATILDLTNIAVFIGVLVMAYLMSMISTRLEARKSN